MKIVWDRQSATVRDVYEVLRERRQIAYTTIMTMMKILEKKKFLKKSLQDRAFVYQPVRPKEQVIRTMVQDFVTRVFDGSAESLLIHLVRDRRLSEKELREIARMIQESK